MEPGIPVSLDTFDVWETWVALGTIALALATGGLAVAMRRTAKETRRLAGSTEGEVAALKEQVELSRQEVAAVLEQAQISREALEATTRPLLIDVPEGVFIERVAQPTVGLPSSFDRAGVSVSQNRLSGVTVVSVPVRNVGAGVARIWSVSLFARSDRNDVCSGRSSGLYVAPQEHSRLVFEVSEDANEPQLLDALNHVGAFDIEIQYASLSGRHNTRTTVYVDARDADGPWRVVSVSHEALARAPTRLAGSDAPG